MEKRKFCSELVLDQLQKSFWMCSFECMVEKRKHLWFLRRGLATCSSHLRGTSITLSTSPFTLIPASPSYSSLFVLPRKGGRGGKVVRRKEKAELVPCHWREETGGRVTTVWWKAKRREQWFPSRAGSRKRTADWSGAEQGHQHNTLFNASWCPCLLFCHSELHRGQWGANGPAFFFHG